MIIHHSHNHHSCCFHLPTQVFHSWFWIVSLTSTSSFYIFKPNFLSCHFPVASQWCRSRATCGWCDLRWTTVNVGSPGTHAFGEPDYRVHGDHLAVSQINNQIQHPRPRFSISLDLTMALTDLWSRIERGANIHIINYGCAAVVGSLPNTYLSSYQGVACFRHMLSISCA